MQSSEILIILGCYNIFVLFTLVQWVRYHSKSVNFEFLPYHIVPHFNDMISYKRDHSKTIKIDSVRIII